MEAALEEVAEEAMGEPATVVAWTNGTTPVVFNATTTVTDVEVLGWSASIVAGATSGGTFDSAKVLSCF